MDKHPKVKTNRPHTEAGFFLSRMVLARKKLEQQTLASARKCEKRRKKAREQVRDLQCFFDGWENGERDIQEKETKMSRYYGRRARGKKTDLFACTP